MITVSWGCRIPQPYGTVEPQKASRHHVVIVPCALSRMVSDAPRKGDTPVMTKPPAWLQEGHLCDARGRVGFCPPAVRPVSPHVNPYARVPAPSSLSLKLVSPKEYIIIDY